jgi:phage terminase small subunit
MGKKGPVAGGSKRTRGEMLKRGGSYFSPPNGMSKSARAIWKLTVSSMPANHFREADRPQLRAYCAAAAKNLKAEIELEEHGEVLTSLADGRKYESPWSKIQDKTAQIMSSLSTKLRITQSSMLSAKGARREWEISQPIPGAEKFEDLLFAEPPRQ